MIEIGARKQSQGRLAIVVPGSPIPPARDEYVRNYSTHVLSNFRANLLKVNDGGTCEVTQKMTHAPYPQYSLVAHNLSPIGAWHACRADLRRPMSGNRPWLTVPSAASRFASFYFPFSIFPWPHKRKVRPAKISGDLASDLKEFVETPSVSGYEQQLIEKIRAKLAAFHPVVDNLGDVIVTIGSGAPRRLIVTPIDEPGFVVSGITADGYLRLQRLPQAGNLPPIFNALYSAQPVKIRTASGKWIDGVVAGISVHLHRAGENTPSSSDIENMYVDIGASSAAEARKAGVDILSPVAINRQLGDLAQEKIYGRIRR